MPTSTQRFRLVGEDDASRAFLEVAAAARLLKTNMDDVGSATLGLAKQVGITGLIPVVAASTAAVTELGTALGAAGGAAGIFGLSAAGTLKGMIKAQQGIATTQKSLDNLTKGTTAYHDAAVKLHEKQVAFNRDYGQAAKGYNDMTDAWHKFLTATGPVTQGTLGKGFELIASTLPKLVPASNAAGHAVGGLIDDLSKWTEGPSFRHLLHFLETSGPKDITAFGHSVGNVLGGLGGILSNFVGPGDHAAKVLEHLTADFDKWGHSKGVSTSVNKFLQYVSDNSPEITQSLGALADASPKIASALGKVGSVDLSLTSKFLTLVAGMPQGAFDVVVTGLFGIAAASKAITAVAGIKALLTGLASVRSGGGLLGKGGGVAGGVLGGKGVVPVFVTNPGFGGGGGSGPDGILGKTGKFAKYAGPGTAIGAGLGIAGVTAIATGAVIGTVKYFQIASRPGAVNAGGMTPDQWKAFNQQRMNQQFPNLRQGTGIKAVGTALDSVRQAASKASQAIELIGPHARDTSKKAVAALQAISGHGTALDSLKAQAGQASQQIDMIGPHARATSSTAVSALRSINAALAAIHDKKFKVTADTTQAMMNVHAMQYAIDALHNKTVIVRAIGGHVPSEPSSPIAPTSPSHTGQTQKVGVGYGGAGGGPGGAPHHRFNPFSLLPGILGAQRRVSVAGLLSSVRGARGTARQRVAAIRGERNQFAAGFQGFATSAFGADYGVDANGDPVNPTVAQILAHASAQRSQAAMVKADVRKLVKLGLSPALLKQLQAAGAAGIPEIQALAGASRADIAKYNSLNKATVADLRSAGMAAGNRIFGKQLHQAEKHDREVERLLRQLVEEAKHNPDKLVAQLKGDHIDLVLARQRRKNGGKLQSDKTK